MKTYHSTPNTRYYYIETDFPHKEIDIIALEPHPTPSFWLAETKEKGTVTLHYNRVKVQCLENRSNGNPS